MADNAFIKIGSALLKHQVKKLVGEETLGVLSEELADIGRDKLDAWLGDKSTIAEIEKAAGTARDMFRGKVNDDEVEQWMVMLPIHDLPAVLSAIEELPTSPDETKLESALRETISLNWKRLSPEQVNNAVNSFLTCLRSALLPIEKQTLMVIGRSVLRTEDKVNLLLRWFEQYIITGKSIEIKQLNPEPVDSWNLKHPYAMPPNFTGRVEERKMLVDWLNKDDENRLFILRALGGFGKSALSWHWLTHDVDSKQWTKVLWWSFYEGDASFEHFIEETLKYLKLEVPQGQRPQVDELLKAMQSQKILLIMDGFERALRAYSSMNAAYQADEESPSPDSGRGDRGEGGLDCVNINAEIFLKSVCSLPNIKSKVLMTTRLTPRTVKPRGEFMLGCREEELTSMQPADAVEFFHKQGIKGAHAEIEAACAPYGYHPLSLRLLAGRILKDFENPADIVVAQKLKIDGDIKQQKHHVLEVSYNSLPPHEGKLLSTIACFRSPVELKTLEAIAENKNSLNDALYDLVERGLLHFDDKNKKFDLHPIVRRYTYERLTTFDRTSTHIHLRDYFAAVETPSKPETLDELAPIIELYHHTVGSERYDAAYRLYNDRLRGPLYYRFGAYELDLQLLLAIPRLPNNLPNLSDIRDKTWNMYYAAMCCERLGRFQLGTRLVQQCINLNRTENYPIDLGATKGTLAIISCEIGNLKTANTSIVESVKIFDSIGDSNWRGISHRGYGRILSICGEFERAKEEFDAARFAYYNQKSRFKHGLSLLSIYEGQSQIWQMNPKAAFDLAQQAREYSGQDYVRESISSDWLSAISLMQIFSNQPASRKKVETKTEQFLIVALSRCRQINLVELEADILLAWAQWYYLSEDKKRALISAQTALEVAIRCEYRLKQADINNFLAQYVLEQEQDKVKAKQYAEKALKLATCDGPPYYYKVAYDEAERMLAKL